MSASGLSISKTRSGIKVLWSVEAPTSMSVSPVSGFALAATVLESVVATVVEVSASSDRAILQVPSEPIIVDPFPQVSATLRSQHVRGKSSMQIRPTQTSLR